MEVNWSDEFTEKLQKLLVGLGYYLDWDSWQSIYANQVKAGNVMAQITASTLEHPSGRNFHRTQIDQVPINYPKPEYAGLNSRQLHVLKYLAEHWQITLAQYRAMFQLIDPHDRHDLDELETRGLIEKRQDGKFRVCFVLRAPSNDVCTSYAAKVPLSNADLFLRWLKFRPEIQFRLAMEARRVKLRFNGRFDYISPLCAHTASSIYGAVNNQCFVKDASFLVEQDIYSELACEEQHMVQYLTPSHWNILCAIKQGKVADVLDGARQFGLSMSEIYKQMHVLSNYRFVDRYDYGKLKGQAERKTKLSRARGGLRLANEKWLVPLLVKQGYFLSQKDFWDDAVRCLYTLRPDLPTYNLPSDEVFLRLGTLEQYISWLDAKQDAYCSWVACHREQCAAAVLYEYKSNDQMSIVETLARLGCYYEDFWQWTSTLVDIVLHDSEHIITKTELVRNHIRTDVRYAWQICNPKSYIIFMFMGSNNGKITSQEAKSQLGLASNLYKYTYPLVNQGMADLYWDGINSHWYLTEFGQEAFKNTQELAALV